MDATSRPAESTAQAFDYGRVELANHTAMQLAAERIRDRLSSIHRDFLAIGAELLTVKESVPHGTFGAWVEGELHITPRAAQSYMNAARLVQSVPDPARETVSHLPPTALYKLAAPSTPKEVVAEVVQAAEGGTLPPPPVIFQRIDEAAREAREVAKAQKAKPGRTEAEAKKLVVRRNAQRVRQREELRQEQAREDAKRARADDALTAAVHRLVSDHRDLMREIAAALNSPASYRFRDLLRAALAEVEARR
jgi:hypothetical protein